MNHFRRGLLGAGALVLAAHAQTIDLRGVVRNKAGAALPGVAILQRGTGLRDTTDAQGRFRLERASSAVRPAAGRPSAETGPDGLRVVLPTGGAVRWRLADLEGRAIRSERFVLGAGTWTLPTADLPTGTYLGRLESEGGATTFRFTRLPGGVASGSPGPEAAPRQAAAALDSLVATKAGYAPLAFPVPSLVDSNLVLTLDTAVATGSEGCGKTATRPDPASKQTLPVSGTNRTYLLFLPTNYDKSKPYPVVFAFHGGGGNGAAARNDFKLEAAANNGAILVYPDGGWNYGSGTDVAFFDAILKDMKSKYCLDTKRVFATGFSLGGIFVNGLGCLRGGTTVRGIVPVAGSGPNPNMAPAQADIACPAGTPPSDVPTMVIHGTADGNALYKYGQWEAEFWRKWNGATTTTTTSPAPYSGCVDYQGGRVPVRFCTHSGGHMVPSWAGSYIWSFVQSIP